jgi:hypothetical protein
MKLSFVHCEPVWEAGDTMKIATRHLSKAEIHVKHSSWMAGEQEMRGTLGLKRNELQRTMTTLFRVKGAYNV